MMGQGRGRKQFGAKFKSTFKDEILLEKLHSISHGLFWMLILILSLASTTGCSSSGFSETFNKFPGFTFMDKDQAVQGPEPLIEPESFEAIDLAMLLSPPDDGENSENSTNPPSGSVQKNKKRLEMAFENFDKSVEGKKVEEAALKRNRIQDRIIAASNQRCASYKRFVKRFDSESNFILGALTTATAGAGAIFTPAATVRALSGIAAIISGVRAEVNESYFQSRTVQVLTKGFETRRTGILKEIMGKRYSEEKEKDTPITRYTVRHAIGDAIRYHDNCSLVSGLEEVADSIERVDDPGLKRMKGFFDTFEEVNKKAKRAAGIKEPTVASELADAEVEAAKNKLEAAQKLRDDAEEAVKKIADDKDKEFKNAETAKSEAKEAYEEAQNEFRQKEKDVEDALTKLQQAFGGSDSIEAVLKKADDAIETARNGLRAPSKAAEEAELNLKKAVEKFRQAKEKNDKAIVALAKAKLEHDTAVKNLAAKKDDVNLVNEVINKAKALKNAQDEAAASVEESGKAETAKKLVEEIANNKQNEKSNAERALKEAKESKDSLFEKIAEAQQVLKTSIDNKNEAIEKERAAFLAFNNAEKKFEAVNAKKENADKALKKAKEDLNNAKEELSKKQIAQAQAGGKVETKIQKPVTPPVVTPPESAAEEGHAPSAAATPLLESREENIKNLRESLSKDRKYVLYRIRGPVDDLRRFEKANETSVKLSEDLGILKEDGLISCTSSKVSSCSLTSKGKEVTSVPEWK